MAGSFPSSTFANRLATLAFNHYSKLPAKAKPLTRSDGTPEWTTLAALFLATPADDIECISIATGVKAMPDERLGESGGKVLHDGHAEVICLRGLTRYFLEECVKIKDSKSNECGYVSKHLETESMSATGYLYRAAPGLKIYMYVSEAPCGDSSLSCTADLGEQKALADDKIFESWSDPLAPVTPNGPLRGRDHFFEVGRVRTKPGRRDSPLTMSKSCSDKLALKQFTSVLAGPAATIINPSGFYIDTLVVPSSQFVKSDFDRCFGPSGRLKPLASHDGWPGGYKPCFFKCVGTDLEFSHSRRSHESAKPSPQSLLNFKGIHSINKGKATEALINGTRMGFKPFSGRGQSLVSRFELAQALRRATPNIDAAVGYMEMKTKDTRRRRVKEEVWSVLGNWERTSIDDFIF